VNRTYTPGVRPDAGRLDLGALAWQTSKTSSGQGGNCVEVAPVDEGGVVVRHSKFPVGPVLAFSDVEWLAFLDDAESFRFTRA
jgi:hypothetical protein